MDKQTFVSKIKGKIDYQSMPTSARERDKWINMYRNGSYLWYIFSTTSANISISNVNRTNPPTSKNAIGFTVNGKSVETISDTLANQALSALPYQAGGAPIEPTAPDTNFPKVAKDWMATHAGKGGCFVTSGVTYQDDKGNTHTGGTADVMYMFKAAYDNHVAYPDRGWLNVVIVDGKTVGDYFNETGVSKIEMDDVRWIQEHDDPGDPGGQYCKSGTGTCSVYFDQAAYVSGDTANIEYDLAPTNSTLILKKPDGTTENTWTVTGSGSKSAVLDEAGTWTASLSGTNCTSSDTATVTEKHKPPGEDEYLITINSVPTAASIKLDGKKTYKLTPETFTLKTGDHKVELSAPGHKTEEFKFKVSRNQTFTFVLTPGEEEEETVEIEVTKGRKKGSVSISQSYIPQRISVGNDYTFRIHVDNPEDGVPCIYKVTLQFVGYKSYAFSSDFSEDIVNPGDYVNLYVVVNLPNTAIPSGVTSSIYTLISTLEAQ